MRSSDYDMLGVLLNAATTWRTATTGAGGKLNRIDVDFPDGSPVSLRWYKEIERETDELTGVITEVVIWEGWKIHTE